MPKNSVISIVDDDASVRGAIFDLMRAMGFAAEAFESAEDFLTAGSAYRTSCLIADMRMSGMSGLGLYKRLVAAGLQIPTILITAAPNDRDQARAMEAGVACYLTKPFNEAQLFSCLQKILKIPCEVLKE